MAPTRIPDDQLKAFLDAGNNQAAAARFFNVSQAAIHQRVKRLGRLTTRVVALERAGAMVEQQLSATDRLARVQRVVDRELSWAEEEATREGADRAALQDAILKLVGEVRQQLGLQLAISRALVDLRVLKEFQDVVLDTIREEAPDTARRIIGRLKERRALRPSADLPSLDGGA